MIRNKHPCKWKNKDIQQISSYIIMLHMQKHVWVEKRGIYRVLVG